MAIRSYQRLATSFKLRTSRSFPYPAEDVRYSQVDRDDVRSSRAPAWTYGHPFVGAHSWNAPLLPPTKIEALVVKRPIENADVEDLSFHRMGKGRYRWKSTANCLPTQSPFGARSRADRRRSVIDPTLMLAPAMGGGFGATTPFEFCAMVTW